MALLHVDLHSDALGMAVSADVILPQQATTQIGMAAQREQVFSTLYLLHGLSDDHTIWQRRTSIERYAARYGIAVVMPNVHRSWYTDMVHGGKYFTYVTEELPRVCRSFFCGMSDKREHNFVAGLSMGGYGAMKCALAFPERYGGVAAFSSAFDICGRISDPATRRAYALEDIFGTEDVAGTVNDVFGTAQRRIAEGAELPRIYLSCGTEDGLLPDSRRMHAILTDGKIEHAYREAPGNHTWEFWDDEIQRALKFFFE